MTKIVINSPAGSGGGGSGTVTSVALTTGTSGTNVNVSGSPITTSGTLVVNIPVASSTNTGKLSNTDWSTFNAKQTALVSGTNIKTINGNSILGSGDLVVSASPAGSTGQVQFNSGGSFGADNDFFWDNTNKRLGIGTATPGTHLDVHSGADNVGTFNRTGSGNSYIQFALLGSNKWRIGYLNSGGDFIIYDVTNSLTRIAITNAGVINLQGNTLRNFKAASSTLSSLTVDSSNGDSYTGTVFLCSGSSVTIDASVDDGFNLSVIQSTSTQTTISVTGGLTIRNRQGHTKTAGQYATVTLLKIGSDLYLGGDTGV